MFSETVSLSSLFTCRAAVSDYRCRSSPPNERLRQRVRNADALADAMSGTGWRPLIPQRPFRSGILLAQLEDPSSCTLAADSIRAFFLAHGISLTCYERGIIRLSMFDRPWRQGELDLIRWTLRWWSSVDGPPPTMVRKPAFPPPAPSRMMNSSISLDAGSQSG